jgi:enamine deaminase RidA (YjgF/YER057c/UK114 family)
LLAFVGKYAGDHTDSSAQWYAGSSVHFISKEKGKGKSMTAQPPHIQFINPPTLASPPGFTHVVGITGGRIVYISGQVAIDQSLQVVGKGDFRAQAEQIFENLKAALAAVGADFTHVVKLNYYFVDMTHLPLLREVRDRYVNTDHPPASTAVEIRKLALDDLLLEIEAVASLPA